MYRNKPLWYQTNLTQVAARFSSVFTYDRPANLHLLPSFNHQELCPDGIFLTPVSGLHFMIHLFDQAETVLTTAQLNDKDQLAHVLEGARQHDDRIAYIEHRHVHFQSRVNIKVAVDAEFDDYMLNKSEEDWLTIRRIKRLPKMSTQDWQGAARQQVTDLIGQVLHANKARLDFKVLLVVNPFRHVTTGPTLYNVRMDSVYTCKMIREIFSGFFRRHRPVSMPPQLKGVDLRNKITLGTKIRISILHQLGSIYTASNPGSSYNVQGFVPRPMLVTRPAQNTGAPRSYNFIQAVSQLKATFSDEHLIRIYQVVTTHFPGELRALFVVLNDDDRDRCLALVKASREQPSASHSRSGPSVNFLPVQSTSGVVRGSGAGMEVDSNFLSSLSSPPPPPPPSPGDPLPESAIRGKHSSDALPESAIRGKPSSDASPAPEPDSDDPKAPERGRSDSESSPSPPRDKDKRGTKRRRSTKKKSKRSRHYSSSSSSSDSSSSGSSSSGSSRSYRGHRSSKSKPKPKSKAKKSKK